MGSSTYCLDMDYLLVCIVSHQSRVSVPHLKKKKKKKASFKKKKKKKKKKNSHSFEIQQHMLGVLCLERHHL